MLIKKENAFEGKEISTILQSCLAFHLNYIRILFKLCKSFYLTRFSFAYLCEKNKK